MHIWGREFWVEGIARARTLRKEHAGHVGGITKVSCGWKRGRSELIGVIPYKNSKTELPDLMEMLYICAI